MLSLIYKDVRVNLVFLLLIVPVFALVSVGAVRAGPVFFWVSLVFAALLMLGLSQMDWRHDVDRFVHSLPVSRTAVVHARYLSTLLAGALALTIAVAASALWGMAMTRAGAEWPRWVSPEMALAWILLFALLATLYLPCYFRWGHGKGYIIGALVIAGAIVAGDLVRGAWEHAGAAAGLPRSLVVPVVLDAVGRFGLPLASVLVLASAGLMLALSARVSARAYEEREF